MRMPRITVSLRVGALIASIFAAQIARANDARGAESAQQPKPIEAKMTDDELGEMLQRAVMLSKFGFYAEAEEHCKRILEQRPDQPAVKQLLNEIQTRRQQLFPQDPAADMKRKLDGMIVSRVAFREAAPREVIEFLREEGRKLTDDKTQINFVWMVTDDAKLRQVTLNLQNVPLLDVVRYVTDLAGLRYRVDPHAIVIYQPQPVEPAQSNVTPE